VTRGCTGRWATNDEEGTLAADRAASGPDCALPGENKNIIDNNRKKNEAAFFTAHPGPESLAARRIDRGKEQLNRRCLTTT
jgi:hypothetical protein